MSEWTFSGTKTGFRYAKLDLGISCGVELAHFADDPDIGIAVDSIDEGAEQWLTRDQALQLGRILTHWAKSGELVDSDHIPDAGKRVEP